jgi:hypothetical protein
MPPSSQRAACPTPQTRPKGCAPGAVLVSGERQVEAGAARSRRRISHIPPFDKHATRATTLMLPDIAARYSNDESGAVRRNHRRLRAASRRRNNSNWHPSHHRINEAGLYNPLVGGMVYALRPLASQCTVCGGHRSGRYSECATIRGREGSGGWMSNSGVRARAVVFAQWSLIETCEC